MRKFLCFLLLITVISPSLFSQQTITGKVTDESNVPLPGVNVVLKGSATGTITDTDGNYSIAVTDESSILEFSYVGFLSEEMTVGTQTTINISLIPDITGIDELVVIGYGTTLKSDITTSVVKVSPDELPKSASSGVSDLLFGKAAGVQVRQFSAQPGGQIDLSIRGRDNPMLVIDGIVVPNTSLESGINHSEINNENRGNLGNLNPDDIESIEILKDASAAIYGVNAGNGVILITTKKGKEGKMKINYNGSRSYAENYPYLKPLGGSEFMEYFNTFERDMYLADFDMEPFGTNTPDYTPAYSEDDINNALNTDWVGEILRPGSIDNHNLSVSGGTDKVSYYVSGGYYNQIGTVENSDMKRFNGLFDLTFKPNKYITLNASANGNTSRYNNSVAGWQTGGAGGNGYTALQAALAYPTYLPVTDPNTGEYTQWGIIGNPVAQLTIKDRSNNTAILAKTSLEVNFIPEVLSGKILYGNNYEQSFRDFYIPSDVNWFDDYRSRGSLQETSRRVQTFETYFTFRKNLGDIVNVNIVAGFGQYTHAEYGWGVQVFDILDLFHTDKIDGALTNGNSWRTENKIRSYFTRGTFDILNRYLVTAAWRYDGVDQFFPDQKFASFPSVSVGWKLSNESFMNNVTAFDLLKIRASIGTTGQNLPQGVAYGLFSSGADLIPFEDGNVIYIPYMLTSLDVPTLTWQKTIMKNIGLDFEIFGSRVSGSLEWFQDDVTNLIRYGDNAANTPALSMVSTQPVNGGHQRRRGIDVAIEGDIYRNENFMWNLALNISHYTYKWIERFEEDDRTTFLNEDDPVRAIYAFETEGILQLDDTPTDYQPETATTPGAPIFIDQNGDNVLDSADVLVYDQTPKVSIGLNNVFRFWNFDLSIYLYGQLGSYKQNYNLNWANARNFVAGSTGGAQNSTVEIKDAWSTENPGGTLPGSTYNESTLGNIGNTVGWGSDYTIAKADFLRARNITLGYTFRPPKYIQSLRLYFDIQNAFVITKYKGADPEIESPAVKGGAAPYPMARIYSLGLNINF